MQIGIVAQIKSLAAAQHSQHLRAGGIGDYEQMLFRRNLSSLVAADRVIAVEVQPILNLA